LSCCRQASRDYFVNSCSASLVVQWSSAYFVIL
jgi:hypothetical protein